MEARHWIAYGLIAVFVLIGTVAGIVQRRRLVARRRRLRGIKDYQTKAATGRDL